MSDIQIGDLWVTVETVGSPMWVRIHPRYGPPISLHPVDAKMLGLALLECEAEARRKEARQERDRRPIPE